MVSDIMLYYIFAGIVCLLMLLPWIYALCMFGGCCSGCSGCCYSNSGGCSGRVRGKDPFFIILVLSSVTILLHALRFVWAPPNGFFGSMIIERIVQAVHVVTCVWGILLSQLN